MSDQPVSASPVADETSPTPTVTVDFDIAQAETLKVQVLALATELRQVGADEAAVKRLDDLANDLHKSDTPWLNLNLRTAFDSKEITERIRQGHTPKLQGLRKLVGWIELVRNGLTVVPILLTWLALSHAVSAYAAAIQADAAVADAPFLILWETGFQGQLAREGIFAMRLSEVAGWDVFVLFVILVLTLAAHIWNDLISDRQQEVALRTGARLDDLLWAVDKHLAPRRFRFEEGFRKRSLQLISSVDKMRVQLQEHSHHFERMTELELQRLTDLREDRQREIEHQKAFMDGLRLVTNELGRLGEPMQLLFENFHSSVRQVQQQVQLLTTVEDAVRAALDEYNQQLRTVAVTTSNQGQQLQQATVRMVEVNEVTSKKLGDFSEVVGSALTHTQVLAEGYQKLRATMAAEHTETVQAAKYIHTALGQLGPTILTLNGLIAQLAPVGAKLNDAASINHLASDRFGELVEDMREIRNTLDRAVNRTEAVVTPELVTGLNGIVLRLSHLQELLEGLVKALPVGAWVAPASAGNWPPLFDENLAERAQ